MTILSLLSCNHISKIQSKAIDIKDLDTSVNLHNNFYKYVNNIWMKNNPLPAEYGRFGSFDALNQENEVKIHSLLTELSSNPQKPGTIAQLVVDFYNSGIDSTIIEKLGISPLSEEFARIDQIKDKNELMNEIAHLHTYSIFPLFNISVDQDPKDSKNVIVFIEQGGLGMPDRDYYTDMDTHMKEIRKAYLEYIKIMLGYIGIDKKEADRQSVTIMNIETLLAKASMTRLELRDPFKTYNKMPLEALQKLAPNINWKNYFTSLGVQNPGNINVMQLKFFSEISKMMNTISLNDLKTYLHWTYFNSMSKYLNKDIVNENFRFNEATLSGNEIIKPRWNRVINFTNELLGMGLGKIYVEKYFPQQAKERMLKLVSNLKVSLSERITKLSWMGDSTKQKALEKLAAINVKIGYPDKWLDYTGLELNNKTLFSNVLKCNNFKMKYMFSKINKPIDKTEWTMPPQTVNAEYNPTLNEICFPAGILQPPFFYMNADDAVNYGGIGVVIGHEITHGFDDQGRLYDKDGNLNNWWTKSDAEAFNKKAQTLVNEFDSFVVLDSVKANGSLTLGENIADLGGINISYTALLKTFKDKEPVNIDGLTPSQRFFISHAKIWAQNIRDKEKLKRTKEDVHSLGQYRINGPLRNVSEFLTVFNINKGDSMYLPEAERAVIW